MTEKLVIRRETRELKILTRPRVEGKSYCGGCQADVRWLAPEEAMLLAKISLREVFRLVETGGLHFAESVDGFLIVCAESLTTRWRKE